MKSIKNKCYSDTKKCRGHLIFKFIFKKSLLHKVHKTWTKTLKFDEEKINTLVCKILPETHSSIYKIKQEAEIVDFLHFCFLCNTLSKESQTKPN